MNYISGTYKNETFEVITRPTDRKNALIGTVIFTVILLIIVFWRFFTVLDPLPEPGGLEASFGNVEFAGGNNSNDPVKEPVEEVTPPVKKEETKSEVSEDEKSIKLDETNKKTSKTPKTTEPKTKPSGASAEDAFNKGNGKTSGNGKVGKQDGKGDLGTIGNGSGKGKGNGDGEDEGDGKSRKCIENCYSCKINKNWSNKGDAIVEIHIDESGKVTYSKLADIRKYPSNAVFDSSQAKFAEDCAKQKVFERGSKKIVMITRISFKFL
jgi:outer membrane biosynthesis protein TonB